MTEQTAGVVGLLILAAVFLFIWWWFGLKTVLVIIGVSVLALVILGLIARSRK
jgi:hypothetical protein